MIFKIFIDIENNMAQTDDSIVSINGINYNNGIIEIEVSRPDEEFTPVGMA